MADLESSDSASNAVPGVTGSYMGNSLALKATVIFCAGLTIYNAIELLILIFSTFSRYATVYFWSLLISSLSLIPYSLGYAFKFFGTLTGNAKWASLSLLTIGWYVMVTGQAVVLWSRLHLVVTGGSGSKILLYTKWMIIFNAIFLHIPTTVVTFGSFGDLDTNNFVKAYNVVEKFQMTGFFVQETILSLIYIIATVKLLQGSFREKSRQRMYLLVTINIVIILLDVGLLSIEYASLLILETILKGVFYSIKLKLEFAILGRLVSFVRSGQRGAVECASDNTGTSSFSGQRTQTSQTRSMDQGLEEGHTRHLEDMSQTHDTTCVPRRPPQSQGSSGSQIPFKEMISEK
ncbi:hypothetical protein N7481_001108 [Penicillium waksmanii]|uniref:uncharacterized protein n=1 Tax=Penicillium waksmanii TaxID=69791 RepID=UPI0025485211|nr:uncharacterized protein N7481_001108 [Penicillium waksmanii]KAJ6000699.1 hypothetical protein N7481_001108 [Penicillium waksmanii]